MPATETTQKDPVIVVLQLTGGNDYLNTVTLRQPAGMAAPRHPLGGLFSRLNGWPARSPVNASRNGLTAARARLGADVE